MEWLKATFETPRREIGVDRDNRILRGFVLAQEGPFKSEGRGEFDKKSLRTIVQLAKEHPRGLKSRFTHPTMSDDGLGKFLGRVRDVKMSTAIVQRDGNDVQIDAVRGDLHFAESASNTPSGDLASYVMDLAEEDSDALSSSLVLTTNEELRIEKDGTRQKDEKTGEPLPPLWRPTKLHASDIVDTGDAVDGVLSFRGLPDELLRNGVQLLDGQFAGKDREYVRQHLMDFAERYLAYRFGDDEPDMEEVRALLEARRRKLRLLDLGDCA